MLKDSRFQLTIICVGPIWDKTIEILTSLLRLCCWFYKKSAPEQNRVSFIPKIQLLVSLSTTLVWGCTYKRLKLAQLLGHFGVFLTAVLESAVLHRTRTVCRPHGKLRPRVGDASPALRMGQV
jgi:hypothetical protein